MTLQNWGPYFEKHEIDIGVSPGSPVVVVWGKNGGGKTNFIEAMKWVFSGGDLGYIRVGPHISHKAIEVGQKFDTSVAIEFYQGNSEYSLTRKVTVDPAEMEEFGDPALLKRLGQMPDRSRLAMQKIGEAEYSSEQSRSMMMRFFPPRLVNSYFFDAAALLESSKNLIDEGDNDVNADRGLDMQNSVETAMGFKGYESYIEGLKSIESDLRIQADKDVADRRQFNQLKSELERYKEELKLISQDIDAAKEAISEDTARLKDYNSQLSGMSHAVEDQKQRRELAVRRESLAEQEISIRKKISDSLSGLWSAPLSARIKVIQLELAEGEGKLREWSQRTAFQASKIKGLREQLTNPLCQTCGRGMESGHIGELEVLIDAEDGILEALKTEKPEVGAHDEGAEGAFGSLWNLGKDNALKTMLENMEDLSRVIVERQDAKTKISQIDSRLGIAGEIDFLTIHNSIMNLESRTENNNNLVKSKTPLQSAMSNKINGVQNKIAALASGTDGVARQRLLKVGKIIRELSFVLYELKTQIRLEIQRDSNLILKELAAEGDKKFTLQISPDYGITTDKYRPNAGFKQQLIFSLFFAIPRVAQAPFPVIVDSPLQHWGGESRSNFLRWCTTGLSQLVLVPHDEELKREEIPAIFGDSLSKFYALEHDSVEGTSSIVRLSG